MIKKNLPSRLSNCPLCDGDKPTLRILNVDNTLMKAISCMDCGCIGPQFFANNEDAERLATTLWNDRPEKIGQ